MQDQAVRLTIVHAGSCTSFAPECPKSRPEGRCGATRGAALDLPGTLGAARAVSWFAVFVTCAMVLAGSGCGGDEAKARQEARELLTRLNAIEDETSLALRKKALDALELMPLQAAENRAAREVCHAAHSGLLQAETEQAVAKQALDQAQKGPSAQPLAAGDAKGVSDAIARSNAALNAAQKHFPQCETAMQGLIARSR